MIIRKKFFLFLLRHNFPFIFGWSPRFQFTFSEQSKEPFECNVSGFLSNRLTSSRSALHTSAFTAELRAENTEYDRITTAISTKGKDALWFSVTRALPHNLSHKNVPLRFQLSTVTTTMGMKELESQRAPLPKNISVIQPQRHIAFK